MNIFIDDMRTGNSKSIKIPDFLKFENDADKQVFKQLITEEFTAFAEPLQKKIPKVIFEEILRDFEYQVDT